MNFASVCYCKTRKSRDCQVKAEWFSRRSWSQPSAARHWELCQPLPSTTCRQEPGTLKNKWYVTKNLKRITESRVVKIFLLRLFSQTFLYAFWTFTLLSCSVICLFWGTSHWCQPKSEEDFNINTEYFCRYTSLFGFACFERSENAVLHALLMR